MDVFPIDFLAGSVSVYRRQSGWGWLGGFGSFRQKSYISLDFGARAGAFR